MANIKFNSLSGRVYVKDGEKYYVTTPKDYEGKETRQVNLKRINPTDIDTYVTLEGDETLHSVETTDVTETELDGITDDGLDDGVGEGNVQAIAVVVFAVMTETDNTGQVCFEDYERWVTASDGFAPTYSSTVATPEDVKPACIRMCIYGRPTINESTWVDSGTGLPAQLSGFASGTVAYLRNGTPDVTFLQRTAKDFTTVLTNGSAYSKYGCKFLTWNGSEFKYPREDNSDYGFYLNSIANEPEYLLTGFALDRGFGTSMEVDEHIPLIWQGFRTFTECSDRMSVPTRTVTGTETLSYSNTNFTLVRDSSSMVDYSSVKYLSSPSASYNTDMVVKVSGSLSFGGTFVALPLGWTNNTFSIGDDREVLASGDYSTNGYAVNSPMVFYDSPPVPGTCTGLLDCPPTATPPFPAVTDIDGLPLVHTYYSREGFRADGDRALNFLYGVMRWDNGGLFSVKPTGTVDRCTTAYTNEPLYNSSLPGEFRGLYSSARRDYPPSEFSTNYPDCSFTIVGVSTTHLKYTITSNLGADSASFNSRSQLIVPIIQSTNFGNINGSRDKATVGRLKHVSADEVIKGTEEFYYSLISLSKTGSNSVGILPVYNNYTTVSANGTLPSSKTYSNNISVTTNDYKIESVAPYELSNVAFGTGRPIDDSAGNYTPRKFITYYYTYTNNGGSTWSLPVQIGEVSEKQAGGSRGNNETVLDSTTLLPVTLHSSSHNVHISYNNDLKEIYIKLKYGLSEADNYCYIDGSINNQRFYELTLDAATGAEKSSYEQTAREGGTITPISDDAERYPAYNLFWKRGSFFAGYDNTINCDSTYNRLCKWRSPIIPVQDTTNCGGLAYFDMFTDVSVLATVGASTVSGCNPARTSCTVLPVAPTNACYDSYVGMAVPTTQLLVAMDEAIPSVGTNKQLLLDSLAAMVLKKSTVNA